MRDSGYKRKGLEEVSTIFLNNFQIDVQADKKEIICLQLIVRNTFRMKKYLTTTLRHLWRHRLFTALNIFGLAIGISACWIIFRIVNFEFSYEKAVPDKKNIYRLVSGFVFDGKEEYNGGVSAPMYQGIRQQIPGLKNVVPVLGKWLKGVEIKNTQGQPLKVDDPTDIVATDSTYFTLLPYRWIAGSKSTSLLAPESVVLTESRAKKYFPNKKPEDILNQTITYYGYRDTTQRTVTGVVADFTTPTEFTSQEFCSLPTKAYELSAWTNTNGSDKLYLQLEEGANAQKILRQIDDLADSKRKEFEKGRDHNAQYKRWYQLLPLKDSHFSTYINEYNARKASRPVLLGLIGIGLFLLVLACINYINMSVAAIPQRAKEIGVRKTLGSSKSQLIAQFLYETILTTFLAGILSYFLSILGFALLKNIIPPGVEAFGDLLQLAIFIIVAAIVVTLLAGIYPAWLITRVKAINIFRKTSFNYKKPNGFSLQKALIVFQFVIALVFITSALIVGNQLHYALTTDMGFDKEAVVVIDVPWKYAREEKYQDKQFALLSEMKSIRGIENISLGTEPMTNNFSSSQYEYSQEGKEPIKRQVFRKWIDTAYLNLYGMKLIAGRNLHASDTTNEFVINETAVKAFGFASVEDAIGEFIGQSNQKFPIVGVVKDFHQQDFYNTIDPLSFESDKENLGTFNIKMGRDASQWQEILKSVEKKWYQFYPPESFSYKFYDEVIAQMYEQEKHLARLIDIATVISIFISCLGLFGLAVLTAFQRTKEIGIRKILGASVTGIIQLLSKQYVYLIGLAIVISAPISWWAMNKWLQNFAYRIQIEWWIFLLAGLVALMVALLTVSVQAIKAAVAKPVESLRTE
jgi:predicted permease